MKNIFFRKFINFLYTKLLKNRKSKKLYQKISVYFLLYS
jgi:hypothetical protein